MNKITIFVLILLAAGFLRFYQLATIPAGLHGDAASQGYNAFSLMHTGKDRYGQSFPILFRSFGSYQPPLYTYLTIIPISILGTTVFAARSISAISGVILVLITYLFIYLFFDIKNKFTLAIIASLLVAISPWSVFFSRLSVEANLALTIFGLSILLFTASLKRIFLFPLACFILGICSYAYYSEGLIAFVFLPIFIGLFRKAFSEGKRWIILGLAVFIIIQIPNLLILNSGALTRRFDQVSYIENVFQGENLTNNLVNFCKIFLKNYLIYFSPKNLFFNSDSILGRTMPELSVFYSWLLIPFILGIRCLFRLEKTSSFKIIGLLLLITPIPAALTGDIFYPLRTLDLLWIMTLIIAIGIYSFYRLIKHNIVKILLFGSLILYSFFSLFISYFILFKYEKAESYGYSYIKLMDKLTSYKDKHIIIDSARDLGIGMRLAYLKRYDPKKMQEMLRPQLKTPYYSNVINTDEIYIIDNIEVKILDWHDTCKENKIFVGDHLAISEGNVEEHKLKPEFEVYTLSKDISLRGYSTQPLERPKEKCPKLKL